MSLVSVSHQFGCLIECGSFAVRDHLRSRDDHHPADDIGDGQISRDAQQRAGVYEIERSATGPVGAGHGLCRLHLGHVQRTRYVHGKKKKTPKFIALRHASFSIYYIMGMEVRTEAIIVTKQTT